MESEFFGRILFNILDLSVVHLVLCIVCYLFSRGILVSAGYQVCQDPLARGFKDHWYLFIFKPLYV